ncbi:PREDICTED: uncharacterized protein LOC104801296 [Tarenaya hassleriana]|uniref:uncharacterized protein LOC104801296 n=1 Tax=Tarenaya hassleriana TaxID=28532 RepID=UPI00053C3AE0|nr:PREDICTED: uncharacterized protein LOC104801296 [Tarenaya hassleriana]
MGKTKKGGTAQRAWSILRMALLWARKGGIFKRWTMLELRSFVPRYLKTLPHHHHHHPSYLSRYGERELSFDETPMFHVKMHRPASMRFLLPCITPHEIDFDCDFDGQDDDPVDVGSYGYDGNAVKEEDENGIDVRAEEFIAKFYEQIKLQRQISFLQYKESITDDDDEL